MTEKKLTDPIHAQDTRRDVIADDPASMQELIILLVTIAKRASQTKNESEAKTN